MFLFSVVGRRYSGADVTIGPELMLIIPAICAETIQTQGNETFDQAVIIRNGVGEDTYTFLVVERF
jgi:hypothetical protein